MGTRREVEGDRRQIDSHRLAVAAERDPAGLRRFAPAAARESGATGLGIKRFKRVALSREKTARNFTAIVSFAADLCDQMRPHGLAGFAQARIGLQLVDHFDEIIEANNPFELKTGAAIACPDHLSINFTHFGQANRHSLSSVELESALRHEALGRDIGDVQHHFAQLAMFAQNLIVHRVPRCAA